MIFFSLGAEEAIATVTANGDVVFENPEHIHALDSTDYLTISLYQNSDMENLLWEYVFEKIRLIADMNQDGEIIKVAQNSGDVVDIDNSTEKPFLFWINDDDDEGEINEGKGATGDVPGLGTADYIDNQVDGMRDLIDFFPVYVDVKSALEVFPVADYTYRLVHSGGALKFTETELYPTSNYEWQRVDAPLKHTATAASLANKTVKPITSSGENLSGSFLSKIKAGIGGIILVEAAEPTNAPLTLEIVRNSDSHIVTSAKLALKIDSVEKMYRMINLQSVAEERGVAPKPGLASHLSEPLKNPDSRTKANYFVFVHGYNVSGEAARGWNAEIYKRMHRLGFNGRFIGVNWHGDTGIDYHHAVYNAFQTSGHLKGIIDAAIASEPGPITIAGHSLGNMVVSNAISHGGLTPARYFMINAATPIEAYDAAQVVGRDGITMKDNMTEVEWTDYPEALYTANWYQLFDPNDERSQLTWKGYFSNAIPYAYNFYSPGEDVVENAIAGESFSGATWNNILDLDFSQHAWVMQEIGKGCKSLIAWTVFKCSGGWNFNSNQDDLAHVGEEDPSWDGTIFDNQYRKYSAADAVVAWNNGNSGVLTRDELAQYGFFRRFSHYENGESGYSYLYGPINTPITLQSDSHRWDLLASGIPAMSFAAAANPMSVLDNTSTGGINANFNMEAMRGSSPPWPSDRTSSTDLNTRWLHSDFRNVALPYVHHTFDKMLELGGFKQ